MAMSRLWIAVALGLALVVLLLAAGGQTPAQAHPLEPVAIQECDYATAPWYDGYQCADDGIWHKQSTSSAGCTWRAHVDWGDGRSDNYVWSGGEIEAWHVYDRAGWRYHIDITGQGTSAICVWTPTHYTVEVPEVRGDLPTGSTADGFPTWRGDALRLGPDGEMDILQEPTGNAPVNAVSVDG